MSSTQSDAITAITFTAAGGTVGVAGAVGVMVVTDNVYAKTGTGVTMTAGNNLGFFAQDDTSVIGVTGGVAGGFVGVGLGVYILDLTKHVHADAVGTLTANATGGTSLGGVSNGTVSDSGFGFGSLHGIVVQAKSSENIFGLVLAIGAGFVGVGVPVGVTLVTTDTQASLGGTVSSGHDIDVSALDFFKSITIAGGVGAGFVGAGAGVDIGVANSSVTALIPNGASVTANSGNVYVYALSSKHAKTYTFAIGGGFVGVSGAVAVWSLGTAPTQSYNDGQGDSGSAGTSGAGDPSQADSDANSSGYQGIISGSSSSDSGNGVSDKANNRINSHTKSGSGNVTSQVNGMSASIGSPTTAALTTPITPGTSAEIFGHVTAGGDVVVHADDNVSFGGIVGSAAGGAVGVGASVLVASIDAETTAEIGGTAVISSGGQVKVYAGMQEKTSTIAFAGAGGAVGVAAQVTVLNDSSSQYARIDSGAKIHRAVGGIDVKAENNNRSVKALTIGGAIGGVAAGVSIGVVNLTGSTKACVGYVAAGGTCGGAVTIGDTGTVSSLTVEAHDNSQGETQAYAVAAGIGVALNGAVAYTHVHPSEVSARLSGAASINVTGAIQVTADAAPSARATAFGVAVSGGAALGVSYAQADDNVNVISTVGNGSQFTAGSLSVNAGLSVPTSGAAQPRNAYASAIAGGGGILLGAEGAFSSATTSGTVAASIGNNALLPDGDVSIGADSISETLSEATGVGIGFIGIGLAFTSATSHIATNASLGTNANTSSTRDGALSITTHGNAITGSASTAGSGGVIAGNGAEADTTDHSSASTTVGATTNHLHASDVTISSTNIANYYEHADSTNASVVGAAGAFASFDGNTSATTTLPSGFYLLSTGTVEISSLNDFATIGGGTFGDGTDNVDAAGGGGISLTAASSSATLIGSSTVEIGANLHIEATNLPECPPGSRCARIGIDAGQQVTSTDYVKLETGGAIDGAGVNSSLTGTLTTLVDIGTGMFLSSTEDAGIGTYTIVVANLEADSSTWGLAAVGFANTTLDLTTNETINVGSGAQIYALGNVNIRSGDSSDNGNSTSLTGIASAQSYVRGLIAVPDASATSHFATNQHTNIFGITVHSGRNTSIGADPHSPATTADGTGHGYELGFIPVTDGSSDGHSDITASVNVNGTIVAGFFWDLELTINNVGDKGSGFTGDTQGVDWTQNVNSVPTTVTYDGSFNPVNFVTAAPGGDPTNNALLVQFLQTGFVPALDIGNLFAAAGNVILDAKSVSGSGTLEAHGGPQINVVNRSKNYLVIDGQITIPFSTGGHVVVEGGGSLPGGLNKSENNVDVGGTVTIHNTFGSQYGSPLAGPGMILAGPSSNLGGLIDLVNDQGSIIIVNSIYAASVSISAPNGAVAVSFNGTAVLGGAPMSEWDSVVVYPAGNPHTALDIANLDNNASQAVAFVASYLYPGFTMSSLLGHSGDTNRFFGGSGGASIIFLGDCLPAISGDCSGSYDFGGGGHFPTVPSESLTVTRADFSCQPLQSCPTSTTTGDPAQGLPGDPGPRSSIVAGTAVLISAQAVDLDTHIEVGPPTTWSVDMPAGLTVPVYGGFMHVTLQAYQALWQSGLVANPVVDLPVNTINGGDALITATYDARTGQITMADVRASGGSGIVRIVGALVNTNTLGNIQVNGGEGHVTVTNETSIALNVQNIYAGSNASATASTSIVDLLDSNSGVQTMYTFRAGQGINVYTGNLSQSMDDLRNAGPSNHVNGNTTEFDPQAGWRLEWALHSTLTRQLDIQCPQSCTVSQTKDWTFDTTGSGDSNNPWLFRCYSNCTGTGIVFIDGVPWRGADSPDSTLVRVVGDTNQFEETITGEVTDDNGFNFCYHNFDGFTEFTQCDFGNGNESASIHGYDYILGVNLTLTMSVRADNPVGITFAGYDRGLISITSNASVYLDGTLTNPNGDTNVTVTNGSIVQPSSQSSVLLALLSLISGGTAAADTQPPILTNNLSLSATGSIGTSSAPISASMTPGGVLNATSGSSGIHLSLGTGAGIAHVSAGSSGNYGDVVISATGNLTNAAAGTNVSGRDITLTTTIGTVGTIATPLVIAAHATQLANGGFNHGFVDVEAIGDIGLTQVAGDLVVTTINSQSGDVWVWVTNGGIYDRFSQTPAQVLSESDGSALWQRLQLTSTFHVADLEAQTVDAYQTQVDQAYAQYWALRANATDYDTNGTPTTAHFDANTLTLTTQGISNMRSAATAALGHPATDADVQTYAQSLYAADVALFDGNACTAQNRCTPGIDPSWRTSSDFTGLTPNATFSYTATPTQVTTLTANAEWTDAELKYFVNRTALEPSSGTPVPPTTPNIHGNNVTLHSSGSIGRLAAPVFVSATDIQNGTITDEQAAALALASAPGDVIFIGCVDALCTSTVPFSYDGSHTLAHYGVDHLSGLSVKQLAPLFVGAGGTFNATSDTGTVFVQSTSPDLRLGFVSAATDASLITAQNITSAGTHSPQIHAGHDLTLLAGAGDIAASHSGSSHAPLLIQVGGTLLSASAGQLLDIQETTGNLSFSRIASGGDSFVSVPNGSLLQTTAAIGVGADNLTINVQNAIGTASQHVSILLPAPSGRLYADAGGNVWIDGASAAGTNTSGDLNVGHVYSSNGNVTLQADGSILNPDATSTASVHGNTISLTAGLNSFGFGGTIGVAGNDFLVDSRYAGSGVLNATATGGTTANGNIYVIETLGDLVLGTVLDTGLAGPTTHLVAPTGSILNGLSSGVNVTAPKLWLHAHNSIGAALKSVTTSVDNVNAQADVGSMWIDQYGPVTIGGVNDNTDNPVTYGLYAPFGSITFTAHSPITIIQDVVAGGDITITSLATVGNDDITLTAGHQVVSTGGSVTLNSADGVVTDGGSVVSAPDDVTFSSGGDITVTGSTITSTAANVVMVAGGNVYLLDGSTVRRGRPGVHHRRQRRRPDWRLPAGARHTHDRRRAVDPAPGRVERAPDRERHARGARHDRHLRRLPRRRAQHEHPAGGHAAGPRAAAELPDDLRLRQLRPRRHHPAPGLRLRPGVHLGPRRRRPDHGRPDAVARPHPQVPRLERHARLARHHRLLRH